MLSARRQSVFWRPDILPQTVVLTRAATATDDAIRFEPDRWPGAYLARYGADGVHALLRTQGVDHRLWMPQPLTVGDVVACQLPTGATAAVAAVAATQFLRRLAGQAPRGELRPRAQDQRVQLSLVALDERRAGASYRAVAERLYGATRLRTEDWRTSSLRDATIRLVRTGEQLARGQHLRLLGRKGEP